MATNKILSIKSAFTPSLQTAQRVDTSDKTAALQAAGFRFSARLRELEGYCENEAAKLREAYLAECIEIHGEG